MNVISFTPYVTLSSELSGSLLSSSSILVSLSLVTTTAGGRNCLRQLVVGTSLSLSRISLSLLPETSECLSACNSHKILTSFRKLLCKTMIATEGSSARKHTGYLNQWSLCCSLMVLKIGSQKQSVCNLRPKHPAASCQ